jgi:hypothetical protein
VLGQERIEGFVEAIGELGDGCRGQASAERFELGGDQLVAGHAWVPNAAVIALANSCQLLRSSLNARRPLAVSL